MSKPILKFTVEIYRKETENSGTINKSYINTMILNEGDEVRFRVENVDSSEQKVSEDVEDL